MARNTRKDGMKEHLKHGTERSIFSDINYQNNLQNRKEKPEKQKSYSKA